MGDYIKARFVGGPMHNQVIEVARLQAIRVPIRKPVKIDWEPPLEPQSDTFHAESYYLHRFGTGYARKITPFFQYIHESLIGPNGEPHQDSYIDKPLPELPRCMELDYIGKLAKAWCRWPARRT